MLQPGARGADFSLPAVRGKGLVTLEQLAGSKILLLFLTPQIGDELEKQLGRYRDETSAFAGLKTEIIAISPSAVEELERFATERQLPFTLLSDPTGQVWRAYAGMDAGQPTAPAAFLVDEESKIRAVYEAARYPNLPGPKSMVRAIRQLDDTLKPAPVAEQDWRMGPFDAPVTLIEYSDYQCHHCIALHQMLKRIKSDYGDRLLVVHRHLPLRATHPLAEQAARAAEAAGAQGKFWAMHDRLFMAAGALERHHLTAYAEELGLDLTQFVGDLDSGRHQEAVNQDSRLAAQTGIKLPPTLFINGILFEGPRTEDSLRQRIAGLLQPNKRGE